MQAKRVHGEEGIGKDGAGGGHGGMGGKGENTHNGGYFHGSVVNPDDFGSNAIYDDSEAKGGGVIRLIVIKEATIDGESKMLCL